MESQNKKRPYVAPKVVEIGAVGELTLGNTGGQFTDAVFPIGTPDSELTFS